MPTRRTIGTVISSENRSVAFDVTTSDTWGGEVEWTESPVSPNRKTQDHGTLAQKTFDVDGEISATTLGPILATEPQRLEILRDELMLMRDERLPCTIVNGFHVLEGYVIKSLSMSRSGSSGNKMSVSLSFVELETTESRTTTIPPSVVFETYQGSFSPTGDLGLQASEEEAADYAPEVASIREANAANTFDVTGYSATTPGADNTWLPTT